jgi:hypothetical protein
MPCGVCEPPQRPSVSFCEQHLQCIWADERLRPSLLRTTDGEEVRVEHPGEWNMGPGPDFLQATLSVGPNWRRLTGDVEIHIRPTDWQRHGHALDSRYGRVCVHLTYFPGTLPEGALPPGTLQIALRPALEAMPYFSFDQIDLMAYPDAAKAAPPPCQNAMQALSPTERGAVLDAAGESRLRRRVESMQAAMWDRGIAPVLYEETMAALGYRPNTSVFRRLARLLPLDVLREKSAGDALRAYALLMGCASLLPDPTTRGRRWNAETKTFIRSLWDFWWRHEGEFPAERLSRREWTFTGLRPANRPERRLMAAAMLFAPAEGLPEKLMALATSGGGRKAGLLPNLLALPDAPYGANRLSFSSAPASRPTALIGPSRAHAIEINVLLPALAALGAQAEGWREVLDALPPEEPNALVRQTALRLFGPDHPPRLYRSSLRKQGLVHIHHDFCLGDRSRCATCPFPDTISSFKQGSTVS